MKIIETYKSDNGELNADPIRAIAHDIAHAFDRLADERAIGTSGKIKSNVSFGTALELLENIDKLMPHLQLWQSFREGDPPFRTKPPA